MKMKSRHTNSQTGESFTSEILKREISEAERKLFDIVQNGIEVRAFWESPTGRFIRDRSSFDVLMARREFETVDPTDAKAIAAIQLRIKAAQHAIEWMERAIAAAEVAERQLDAMDYTQ